MGRPRKKLAVGVPPPPPQPVRTDVAAAAASAGSESDDAFRQPQRSACRIKRVQRTRSGCASCKLRWVFPVKCCSWGCWLADGPAPDGRSATKPSPSAATAAGSTSSVSGSRRHRRCLTAAPPPRPLRPPPSPPPSVARSTARLALACNWRRWRCTTAALRASSSCCSTTRSSSAARCRSCPTRSTSS